MRYCRTLQYLARTVGEYGEYPHAISLAEEAVSLASGDPIAEVNSRTVLALLYRDADMIADYMEVINAAAELAEKSEMRGKTRARVLNMAAAAYRRGGDYETAITFARRSVRIGEKLGDDRHIAHAQHTLAAIQIDAFANREPGPAEVEDILALLRDSRSILAGFHDVRGVGLVDATSSRLYARIRRLRSTND